MIVCNGGMFFNNTFFTKYSMRACFGFYIWNGLFEWVKVLLRGGKVDSMKIQKFKGQKFWVQISY